MNKSRLEAFSDGVFAIVVTLLVLEIRVPKVAYEELLPALEEILPKVLGYALSFVIVGLYWISHHNLFKLISKIDQRAIWYNMFHLLFVGFLPFPTALLGEFPFTPIPIIVYVCTLLLSNLSGFLFWRHAYHQRRLLAPEASTATVKMINRNFLFINLAYLVALPVSFWAPLISYLFLALPVLLLIFRERSLVEFD